jgi:predicted glutamine amidotransferase
MTFILIILIIHFLLSNYKTTILCCGLFGWSGSHPSRFNRYIFTMLGLANENRGTDSCGIYSNKEAVFGVRGNSRFSEFMKEIKPIKVGRECVVIGHTRKASVGIVNEENAQPIILSKDSDESAEIILTHNGTISDPEDLAKEFGIDASTLDTDSQILASIMAQSKNPLKVLSHYVGTAALAFYLPKKDEFYLYKGHSSNYVDSSYASEERPLYYVQDGKNNLYYSSIESILKIVSKNKNDVKEVPDGKALKIQKGEIIEEIDIDRTKVGQKAPFKTHKSSHSYMSNNYAYDGYDDDFGRRHWPYPSVRNYGSHTPAKKDNDSEEESKSSSATNTVYSNPTHINDISFGGTVKMPNKLIYDKGRYFLDEKLASGILYVNPRGYVKSTHLVDVLPIAFIQGVMLDSIQSFQNADKLVKTHYNNLYDKDLFNRILKVAALPIAKSVYSTTPDNALYYIDPIHKIPVKFSGKFRPYFTPFDLQCVDGMITKVSRETDFKEYIQKDLHNKVYY